MVLTMPLSCPATWSPKNISRGQWACGTEIWSLDLGYIPVNSQKYVEMDPFEDVPSLKLTVRP